MRITQKQIPQFRLDLFSSNKLAVPRLGNVQLRFHFLRRGTSVSNGLPTGFYSVILKTEKSVLTSKLIIQ